MTCNAEGCDKPARCKGLCDTHYRRLRKHGDPTATGTSGPKRSTCIIPGCDRRAHRYGRCYTHDLDERKQQRRQAGGRLPDCPFCAAHLILTNRGYSDDEIAARIHKPPAWLAAHLKKGHQR